MNRKDLRAEFLAQMPALIIANDKRTYTEWLEDKFIRNEEVKEKCNLQNVINCPFCDSSNTVAWGVNEDWNCLDCKKDFEGCL